MNSIFLNVCGIILVILACDASYDDCEPQRKLSPPFYFSSRIEKDSCFEIHFKVILVNLSRRVLYQIYEQKYETDGKKKQKIKEYQFNKDKNCFSKTWKYEIKPKLTSISLEIKSNVSWCNNITIYEGKVLYTNAEVALQGYSELSVYDCSKSSPCIILIDLKNKCSDFIVKDSQTEAAITTARATSTHNIIESVSDISFFNNTTPLPNITTTPRVNINTANIGSNASDTISAIKQKNTQNTSTVLIYVISSVIVTSVIILVIYISVKKYCHRNSQPEETMELNTYATATELVYADLSLVHGDSQPTKQEEATYAKIIGVLKPVDTNVKSK